MYSQLAKMPVLSLIIPVVAPNIDAGFIARTFYKLEIATIKQITLLAVCDTVDAYCAYIEIGHWHDTESAYHFIERLRNPNKEARIVYDDPSWWVIFENTDNYHVTFDPRYKDHTTEFVCAYGEEPTEAINDLKKFFDTSYNVSDDYNVMYTINLEGCEIPIMRKEQDDDCVFTAHDWNNLMDDIAKETKSWEKFMGDIEEDNEEYRKLIESGEEEYDSYFRRGRSEVM